MIEFTCPGCLSRCVANGAFSGMRARCVVCGAFIRIPAETGAVAFPLGPVPAGPLPSRPSKPSAAKPAAPKAVASKPPRPSAPTLSETDLAVLPDLDDLDDLDDLPAAPARAEERDSDLIVVVDEPPVAKPPKAEAKAKKSAAKKKPAKVVGSELDGKLSWDDYPAEAEPAPAAEKKPNPRRQQLIIGGSVLAAVVIALVVGLSGGEKPKLPDTPPADESAKEPPPPPPKKKVEEPKAPPPPEVAVAPWPRAGGDPTHVVAAQLAADRAANPAAFDAENAGKPFLLRGTFARSGGGVLFLADATGEEGGIACAAPKITFKGPAEDPPDFALLQPGQAVLVRGWYAAGLRFTDCRVVATAGPADEEYREKIIELVGLVGTANATDPDSAERFPSIILEAPTTDCPVSVRCLFRGTERDKLTALRPGQPVTIRGKCEGRSFRVVRLHDCALVPNMEPPTPGVARVSADRFYAAYEVDLLHFARPNPAVAPVTIAAEQLAAAFGTDPRAADAAFRYKPVVVTGRVIERQPGTRTVILETATSQRYQVSAVFTPSRYAALRDLPKLTIRGVCVGVAGKFVRVENADASDPDAGNPALRITADYLPLQPGRELLYDLLTPTGVQNNPITRFSLKVEGDTVRMTPLRSGTFPRPTLFGDGTALPKWTKDLRGQKGAVQMSQFRVSEGMLETRDKPPLPAQPGLWWDPILKIEGRRGDTWTTSLPDGRTATYTVAGFSKDAAMRHTVEIQRVTKNPRDMTTEEATITYARGVGEVRRVITRQGANGKAFTLVEMRLVETEPPGAPEPPKDDK